MSYIHRYDKIYLNSSQSFYIYLANFPLGVIGFHKKVRLNLLSKINLHAASRSFTMYGLSHLNKCCISILCVLLTN